LQVQVATILLAIVFKWDALSFIQVNVIRTLEPDPTENCHLNVKNFDIFQNNCQKLSFFPKIANGIFLWGKKKKIFGNFFGTVKPANGFI